MKRRFQGLSDTGGPATDEVTDGVFLMRIEHAHYRWHAQKPCYLLRFSILEPKEFTSQSITGRVYCTPKALRKLSWLLRDFGYDSELFGHDEIEDKRLVGLTGVIKISHVVHNGSTLLNLEAFAPAGRWNELSAGVTSGGPGAEMAS
jgi:hypothetical protein